MNTSLVPLMTDLLDHVKATNSDYSRNLKVGVLTHPIPFFGDLPNASVATIGLNPSATEFTRDRWPTELAASQTTDRLLRYFHRDPHPWFDRWEEALSLIGASYKRDAVHIDISPRATVNAASVSDSATFEAMLECDLPWMIRFLDMAPKLRLLLMAGAATRALYMDEFIARRLPHQLGCLEGPSGRPLGVGKVKHYVFVFGGRRIPAFFCSSSPSDRRHPELLLSRVRENADLLRGHLRSDRVHPEDARLT